MADAKQPAALGLNPAFVGFLMGAAALILVLVHFVAGPFAPQQGADVTLGELASGMAKAAARDLIGMEQPAPQTLPWDIDRVLRASVMGVGGLAVVCGIIGLVKHNNARLCSAAICLGAGAIFVQLFTWVLVLVLCALVLIAFFNMIGDIVPWA